ncbi:MAG: hypothetical protein JKY19_00400 [Alcanivoracaceae bacterium]|nr:hypothetical protein [Alcanivoracaceae bacterium]
MKEVEKAGHVMFNADAWQFSDPVVFWVTVTVVFCISMLTVLFFWVRKNMADERKNKEGGTNS